MRTQVLVLVLVASCGGGAPSGGLVDAAAQRVDLDVLVTAGGAAIYTGDTDLGCACSDGNDHFPAPGTCAGDTDAVLCSCQDSCFTDVGLEAGGVRVATGTHMAGSRIWLGYNGPRADLVLVLEGCGHARTEIPLAVAQLPTPTVSMTSGAPQQVTVSWQSNLPEVGALPELSFGIGAQWCHITGTQSHTFDGPYLVPGALISSVVTSISQHAEVATPLGPVHIWWGGRADAGTTKL
jgi:hypothetical protein